MHGQASQLPPNTEYPLDEDLQTAYTEAPDSQTILDRARQAYDAYQVWAEQNPVKATVVETVALYGARKAITHGFARAGVRTENAFLDEHVERAAKHPAKAAVQATVLAPIKEEIAFRGILDAPARHAERQGKTVHARLLRLGSAALFAAGHSGAIRPSENWPHPPFVSIRAEGVTVPVEQFIGANNYQRLARDRGFLHAVLGHAVNNTLKTAEKIPVVYRKYRESREP